MNYLLNAFHNSKEVKLIIDENIVIPCYLSTISVEPEYQRISSGFIRDDLIIPTYIEGRAEIIFNPNEVKEEPFLIQKELSNIELFKILQERLNNG